MGYLRGRGELRLELLHLHRHKLLALLARDLGVDLGFGRIVASEIEVPIVLVNLV
jgi:hypothetical protein